jgi:hypothetical protein
MQFVPLIFLFGKEPVMRLRFFTAVMTAFLMLAFSCNARADCSSTCSGTLRSASPLEGGGIENLYDQQQASVSPFNANLRLGGLYDSRVGSPFGGSGNADWALAAALTAGWQAPLKGNVGVRLDYRGYMDFHQDFHEYNLIDQTLSLEPQYKAGPFIYSLPLSFNLTMENGEHDYNRYAVSPTLTYLIPDTRQAVSVYGIVARIDDKDKDFVDEDGVIWGGGGAYLYAFENKSRVRLSLTYQHTAYDNAMVWQYMSTSDFSDKRRDDAIVAGLDILLPITDHFGLYINYAFIHSYSNVDLYKYDRHLAGVGVELKF